MIETKRLILRRFLATDWPALHRYLSDPEVVRYEPYEPFTEAASRYEAIARAGNEAFWAVCLREDGLLIGNLYMDRREHNARAIGFVFSRSAWGHGYATEAAQALMDRAFAEGAHRIFAECNPDNTASWRLMERLSMRREAHFHKNLYAGAAGGNKWQDTYVYAILRDEWGQSKVIPGEAAELPAKAEDTPSLHAVPGGAAQGGKP